MDPTIAIAAGALVLGAYDPEIDTALAPHSGLCVGVGVQRLQDEFGLSVSVSTPRFLEDRLALTVVFGPGWYPDLRALPTSTDDQDFGAWSLYGHARALIDFSSRLAVASGRLYATLGPSFLFLPSRLSTTRVGIGFYGAVGVEFFSGDAYRAHAFAFFFELGGAAHNASQDVENRTGPIEETNRTVDRLIATGLALTGGLRVYFWR